MGEMTLFRVALRYLQYAPKQTKGDSVQELKIKRVYRHFKGDYYLVEDIARHSETNEQYVVYRKLYGDGSLWIRPIEMFLSEVDHGKYPSIEQTYRFQLQDIESKAHDRADEMPI